MAMMGTKDKPTYYNIVIMGNRIIASDVPKSKVHKIMKDLALTYNNHKMEAVLVDQEDCK